MNIAKAIFLGLVQGLTEFLPVSSSGHLVLFQRILGISGDMLLFDIVLHLGTLFAVLVVFRKDIWECIKKPFGKTSLSLVAATIPAILIALLFGGFIEKTFSGNYLGFGFLITAGLLIVCQGGVTGTGLLTKRCLPVRKGVTTRRPHDKAPHNIKTSQKDPQRNSPLRRGGGRRLTGWFFA